MRIQRHVGAQHANEAARRGPDQEARDRALAAMQTAHPGARVELHAYYGGTLYAAVWNGKTARVLPVGMED